VYGRRHVSERIVAVRADEYLEHVGGQRYAALPREEIERLYGSVELHLLGRDALHESSGYLPLVTYTAAHYNYTWLTYQRAQRSLGVSGFVLAGGEPPLFLDESLQVSARREMERAEALSAPAEWRLAGLINDGRRLGLVYVAKLRQPWSPEQNRSAVRVQCCNNGELLAERPQFEPWSQLLIDNVSSL
jgi:hypothetical protein